MHLKNLYIEGFRSYREPVVVPLDAPGLILLTGENRDRGKSSGSGKSSIFKALNCVLFEENDDDSVKDDGINKVYPEGGMSIGADFLDDDGQLYYAQYSRKHPVAGTDWNFWKINAPSLDAATDDQFEDMRGAKLGDTKEKIEQVIGLNYGQFGNVAYIAQRRIAEFIAATDKDRREVFTRALGLTAIDKYIETTRAWKRETDGLIKEGKGRYETLVTQRDAAKTRLLTEEQIEEAAALIAESACAIERCKFRTAEIDRSFTQMQNMTELRARESYLRAEVDKLARQQQGLAGRPGGVPNAVTQVMEDSLAELESQATDLSTRMSQARTDAARARAALAKLGTKAGECGQCHQEVTATHLQNVAAGYEQVIRDALATAGDLDRQHQQARGEFDEKRAYLWQQRDDWNEWARIQNAITETAKELDATKAKVTLLRETLSDLVVDLPEKLNAERRTLQEEQTTAVRQKAEQDAKLQQHREHVNRYEDLRRSTSEQDQLNGDRAELLANLKVSEKLLDRFKAWKISTSRTQFNNSMAKYLSLLTDGEITAELVTEKPLASGKGVKQEIDIIVTDGEKTEVPIKQYSGGEQAGLSLSITGAFWDLASTQTGCSVNLLLLDEPFNDMDSYGEEKACALLKHMRESGRTIMVVTNRQSVRERGTFDREVRAVKENHKTHLEFYDLRGEH